MTTPLMTHAALLAYLTERFAALPDPDLDEVHEHYGAVAPIYSEVLAKLGHEGYLVTFYDDGEDDFPRLVAIDPRHRQTTIPDAFTEGTTTFDNLSAVASFFLELPRFLVVPIDGQPPPIPNDNPAIWDLVIADAQRFHGGDSLLDAVVRDMRARDVLGAHRYGVRLQAGNGRLSTLDALEESLDMAAYLRIAVEEGVPGAEQLYRAHLTHVFAAKRVFLMQMTLRVRRLRDAMNGPEGDAAARAFIQANAGTPIGDFATAFEAAGQRGPK